LVRKITTFAKSINILRLDIWLRRAKGSSLPATKEDSSSDLMGSFILQIKR